MFAALARRVAARYAVGGAVQRGRVDVLRAAAVAASRARFAAWPSRRGTASAAGAASSAAGGRLTPAMSQYLQLKRQHPAHILMFRMGDFYEMFFEDAERASAALDIALTKRGKHNGEPIPMCGIPHWSLDVYLHKFVRRGFRVAVCEQIDQPAVDGKRRGMMKREVARLVTPGTLTEDSFLSPREHNYLAWLSLGSGDSVSLAWLDMSTGEFQTQLSSAASLESDLARIAPAELVLPAALRLQRPELSQYLTTEFSTTEFDAGIASAEHAHGALKQRAAKLDAERAGSALAVSEGDPDSALQQLSEDELVACASLLAYVEYTQRGRVPHVAPPARYRSTASMTIDASTRRNLELTQTLAGEKRGSLLAAIDRTVTAAGARLLASRLASPLTDVAAIHARLGKVEFFVKNAMLAEDMRQHLRRCHDLDRCVQRLSIDRGSPRDLRAISTTLECVSQIRTLLAPHAGQTMAAPLRALLDQFVVDRELVRAIERAIVDEPPPLSEGGFVKRGFDADLDATLELRDNGRKLVAALQQRYREQTGVSVLKIKHNNLIGYHIELPQAQEGRALPTFTRCQSLVNASRFKSEELIDLETRIASAASEALAKEMRVFHDLCAKVLAEAARLHSLASAVAAVDVAAGLAVMAEERGYCMPTVMDNTEFQVRDGRHVIVENKRVAEGDTFVANDCSLGPASRLWLVTGPNMGGKSTFLRQNALIAVMAQLGSFVPASHAVLGVVDRLFCRVGASDDLAHNRSTFMVEMVETANILKHATSRSLVVMDEIGRGTSTGEGLAIAWAVLEHLHQQTRSRTLFATHFHELGQQFEPLEGVRCMMTSVMPSANKTGASDAFLFLHQVRPGIATHSYGIPVASLAGLPQSVVARAQHLFDTAIASRKAAEASSSPAPSSRRKAPSPSAPPAAPPPPRPRPRLELSTLGVDARALTLSQLDALVRDYRTLADAAAAFIDLVPPSPK